MPEYESSTHFPNRSDRIWSYLSLMAMVALTSVLYVRGVDGFNRLSLYVTLLPLLWAGSEFIKHRAYVRLYRRHDGYIQLGERNLFWSSDRDPDDRHLI